MPGRIIGQRLAGILQHPLLAVTEDAGRVVGASAFEMMSYTGGSGELVRKLDSGKRDIVPIHSGEPPTTLLIDQPTDGVVVITLNRPERLNAITSTMITELGDIVDAVNLDPSIRTVILTGAGRGFCAGLDLGDSGDAPGAVGENRTVAGFLWQDHLATLHEKIHRCRAPWIAAVNGPCVGGGFAMALACDIRYATTSATFGAVFLKVGVSNCDMGTSYFLPRLVGASRAAELMLTARIFDAAEAEHIGLVLDLTEDNTPDSSAVVERAIQTAEQIRKNPPFGTWMTKETMWQTIDAPSLRHALDMENRTQVMCSSTGEIAEARKAFVEKRPPSWQTD